MQTTFSWADPTGLSAQNAVTGPKSPVTAIVVCRDDEERVGHVVRRLAAHLRSLRLRFQILVVDEGSADNTLALLDFGPNLAVQYRNG